MTSTSLSAPPTEFEPAVMISMVDDRVIISPPTHPDLETTHVLVAAAAAAVIAGSTVMIDLDPDTASDDLVPFGPTIHDVADTAEMHGGLVRVLGPGMVQMSTHDAFWTIDLSEGRLVRSDKAIDPWFVTRTSWTRIRALWATCATVTVLTADGTYLSTRTAWSRAAN